MYGKKDYLRADHAHKKCYQIIIPINGQIKITTFFNKEKKIFLLNSKNNKLLFVPTYTWLRIKFYKNNDSLLTLCNFKYDKKEYINNFNEFNKKYF